MYRCDQIKQLARRPRIRCTALFSCNARLSSFSLATVGARLFCYWGIMLTLSATLPCVESITFQYNGFKPSDLYINPDSNWVYHANQSFYHLPNDNSNDIKGRVLHPGLVQMKNPANGPPKSFSTTFIFQIYNPPIYVGVGSGMAFIMVPNNSTQGASHDYLGLITATDTRTQKDELSDQHTFGVEFDTIENTEFGDPNDNHIGINLASMNSTFTFIPTISLVTEIADLMYQVWIDYSYEADSQMDISITQYKQGKPATPQKSFSQVDLSLLEEYMYIGFSAAIGVSGTNDHILKAWSFSTDGEAPQIFIAKDAPPPASPPPPGLRNWPPPPASPPTPDFPPPVEVPISSPPGPISRVPPPIINSSPPPPPPAPINPSPASAPSPSNIVPGAASPVKGLAPKTLAGILVPITFLFFILAMFMFWQIRMTWFTRPKIRIFIAHSGGKDGSGKTFPIDLHSDMMLDRNLKHRVEIFLDVITLPTSRPFQPVLFDHLNRTEVGIVVLTEDFFTKHWPMTELTTLVEISRKKNGAGFELLPLYFKVTHEDVVNKLNTSYWEKDWKELEAKNNHPVLEAMNSDPEVEAKNSHSEREDKNKHAISATECKKAVRYLCDCPGVEYGMSKRGHEQEYRKSVVKEVRKLCNKIPRPTLCQSLVQAMKGIRSKKKTPVPSQTKETQLEDISCTL